MNHSQKHEKKHMICTACGLGNCNECVDIMRAVYSKSDICECTKASHSGEPRDKQILDPDTGAVHAPDLVVDQDGTVEKEVPQS